MDGATYTDANVELKAIYLLLLIALFATALFIANIWRRGWVLPVLAVGLWALVAIIAGEAVPQFVQRFQVEPAESSKEAKYIANNIKASRQSYNLEVDDKEFDFKGDLTAAQLRDNAGTVRNIRLWDPDLMRDSFAKLQGIRSFYAVNDVDIDRYGLKGDTTQVMLSARDLKTSGVPQASWEARHLTYTHGYGMILSPANAKEANGQPSLLAEDIPVRTSGGAPVVKRPEIYFGEDQSGYVIVNTGRQEIDYQARNTTKFTEYTGKDGIKIGSGVGGFVRKAAFALRFGDINPLISSNLKPDSRVLVRRDVQNRLSGVAPFLEFDHDPYLVAVDGRLKYIDDGYTTTPHFPNAQRADTTGLDPESGLRQHRFNYVRNSVKAVVDAYDGTVRLYVVDKTDPLIKAYRSAFPKLFVDSEDAPASLRAHFRYPEDLFTVQTQMWGKYHQGDPDTFYNGNDEWNVAQEAGINQLDQAAQAAVGPDGEPITPNDRYQPQYLLMRLPGESAESFLILRPFVPASSGDNAQKLLTAFMVAKSDPKEYGKLETYVMPSDNLPNGPERGVRADEVGLCGGERADPPVPARLGVRAAQPRPRPDRELDPLRAVAVRPRRQLGHARAAPGDRLVPDVGRRQPRRGRPRRCRAPCASCSRASACRTRSSPRRARTRAAAPTKAPRTARGRWRRRAGDRLDHRAGEHADRADHHQPRPSRCARSQGRQRGLRREGQGRPGRERPAQAPPLPGLVRRQRLHHHDDHAVHAHHRHPGLARQVATTTVGWIRSSPRRGVEQSGSSSGS